MRENTESFITLKVLDLNWIKISKYQQHGSYWEIFTVNDASIGLYDHSQRGRSRGLKAHDSNN